MAPFYRFDQVELQLPGGNKWKRSTNGSVPYRVENGVFYEAEGFFVDSKSRDVTPTFSQWRKMSPIDPASWTSNAKSLSGWGTWIDPAGDCRLSLEGSNLAITAAGGMHGLWPRNVFRFNLHGRCALQEVHGDFSYELTIPPCEIPQADAEEFKNNGGVVSGSLLLWQDSENFVRLDRDVDPRSFRAFVELLVYRHGCIHYSRALVISDKVPIQFRVVRKEGKFTQFEFREPNQEWRKIPLGAEGGPLFIANELQSRLYIGPAVASTATSEVTIQFSDRKLEGGNEKK